jgi:hypothetical protein
MGYTSQARHEPSARAKKNINLIKPYTYEALHQRTITIEIITGEKRYSLWYHHKKNKFCHSIYTWRSVVFFFFTSAVLTGVQMGQMSKLGWLTGWCSRDIWADSLYFMCMWCLVQSARLSLLSNIFCGLLRTHVGLDFSSKPYVWLYLCSLMNNSEVLLVSPM